MDKLIGSGEATTSPGPSYHGRHRRPGMSDQSITVTAEVEWRDIPGYLGCQASSDGRIRTKWKPSGVSRGRYGKTPSVMTEFWRFVKIRPQKTGYHAVTLPTIVVGSRSRRQVFVHTLVCLAFHGLPPQVEMEVAHFPDKDPGNNHPDNLKWATSKENQNHRRIHGTSMEGTKNKNAKLNDDKVREIRRLHSEGWNGSMLEKKFAIRATTAMAVAKRKTWRHVI